MQIKGLKEVTFSLLKGHIRIRNWLTKSTKNIFKRLLKKLGTCYILFLNVAASRHPENHFDWAPLVNFVSIVLTRSSKNLFLILLCRYSKILIFFVIINTALGILEFAGFFTKIYSVRIFKFGYEIIRRDHLTNLNNLSSFLFSTLLCPCWRRLFHVAHLFTEHHLLEIRNHLSVQC